MLFMFGVLMVVLVLLCCCLVVLLCYCIVVLLCCYFAILLFCYFVLPGMFLILPISLDCIGVDAVLIVFVCFCI